METTSVTIMRLPVVEPPAPVTGGRIISDAGNLAQIVNGQEIRHLYYVDFNIGGAPRGNHYHHHKHENMYIIQGKLELTTVDVATEKREHYTLQAGDVIFMPPNVAHAYVPLEYTQAICFAPEVFDPAKPDITPYRVM